MNPVVVHGGGPEITAYMERLGLPVEFVGGLRVTDAETVEVAKMVLVGKVNKDIVLRIDRHGQPAVGLCGDDGDMLFRVARQHGARRERRRLRRARSSASTSTSQPRRAGLHPGDRVGRRRPRRAELLQRQRRRGRRRGRAARSAPTRCIFLTDVEGWLRDPADRGVARQRGDRRRGRGARCDGDRRRHAPEARRPASTRSTAASRSAHIVDGRVPHSLLLELFTDAGIGTKIRPAR